MHTSVRERVRPNPLTCSRVRLQAQVVIDLHSYFSALPQRIEAFFYTRWASPEQQQNARNAHASFTRKFGRRAPLLVYDPDKQAAGPFTLDAG